MNRYREAARVLWNCFFLEPEVDFDDVETFDGVRATLFGALVLRDLGSIAEQALEQLQPHRFIREPVPPFGFIRVVPVAERLPIHIKRAGLENGYWDADPKYIDQNTADLLYVDCFDWDVRGYREFHYYRLEIRSWCERPDLEGRAALISVEHCRVYADVEAL